MDVNKYKKTENYHLWNGFTNMDTFIKYLGVGPTVIVRGEGPYVFDSQGKRYINGLSSMWNVAIGHGRKELVEAASKQMRELAYSTCYSQVHPMAIELAAKLVEISPKRFTRVCLGSNGSEIVGTSFKMSRQYHRQSPNPKDYNKYKIISLKGSYHGVTYGALSTSGLKKDEERFGPLLPGFIHIEPPYCYRCPYGKNGHPECGLACAKALEDAIKAEGTDTVAALIIEPIMGVLGMIPFPQKYYEKVGEICKKYGVLFIADEISTGFGRAGKLLVSEDWNFKPDIVCLGKGISSGYLPLTAMLVTEEIYSRFLEPGKEFDYGSTCSGHPVCAAVGLANINIIINEKLPENAAKIGSYLKSELEKLKEKHELIGDVRGVGLMIGIELVKDRKTKEPLNMKEMAAVASNIYELGLLVYPCQELNYSNSTIGLLPPLIIDKNIADEIVGIIDKSLSIHSSTK